MFDYSPNVVLHLALVHILCPPPPPHYTMYIRHTCMHKHRNTNTHKYIHTCTHITVTYFSGPGSCPPSLLSEPSSSIIVPAVLSSLPPLLSLLLPLGSQLSVEEQEGEDSSEIIPWSWSRERGRERGRAPQLIKSLAEVTLKYKKLHYYYRS